MLLGEAPPTGRCVHLTLNTAIFLGRAGKNHGSELFAPLYDKHKQETYHLRQCSDYNTGKGGHSKRISDCISTPYPRHAMQDLGIKLNDIYPRFSLWQFVSPHHLRSYALATNLSPALQRYENNSRWIDCQATHSVCCSSAYGNADNSDKLH